MTRARAPRLALLAALLAPAPLSAAPALQRAFPYDAELHRPLFNAVYAVAQDHDGYLWMAADGIIARYDGSGLMVFSEREIPALADRVARRLAVTRDGALWAALAGGLVRPTAAGEPQVIRQGGPGLLRRKDGRWADLSSMPALAQGLPSDAIWALAAADDGALWLGTERGLARFDGRAVRTWTTRDGLPSDFVLAMLVDGKQTLVGTTRGAARLDGDRFAAIGPGEPVLALASDPSGDVWLGTARGLARVGAQTAGRRLTVADGLPADEVVSLVRDRAGTLWAGTTAGASRITDGVVARDPVVARLAGTRVTDLVEDREGSVWASGETSGLTLFRRRWIWNFGPAEGLPGGVATAVLRGRARDVWIATPSGLGLWDGERLSFLRAGVELPPGQPLSLALAPDGAVWVATAEGTLWRVEQSGARGGTEAAGGKIEAAVVRGAPAARNRILFFAADGDLWTGEEGGGLSRLRPVPRVAAVTVVSRHTAADGVCPATPVAATQGAGGRLWFAADGGGVTRHEGGRFSCLGKQDGLPALEVTAVHEDAAGDVWIGLRDDRGLLRLRAGKVHRFDESAGLGCDSVHGIADDGAGHLWLTCRGGAARVEKQELNAHADGRVGRVRSLAYNHGSGLRTHYAMHGTAPAAIVDAEGVLWMATPIGVTAIAEPGALGGTVLRPAIEEVRLDGVALSPTALNEITSARATLMVRFAAPTFARGQSVAFRHRIDGLDDRWSQDGYDRTVFARGLQPGDYRFRVVAVPPNGGPVSPEVTVAFRLVTPLHRRPIVWLPVGALALAAGLALHRWRLRRLRGRYEAIQHERARIARDLHDGLGQGFTAIDFHLEALRHSLGAQPAQAEQLFQQTREVLRLCHEQARRTVWDLREGHGAGAPLADRIAEVVRQQRALVRGGRPQITLRVSGDSARDVGQLSHELPYVALEAITNAIRHADASQIAVELRLGPDAVELTVEDDGRGFSADQPATGGGFGLLGMKERAVRLNAELAVDTHPGRGTTIRLRAPLRGDR